MAAARRAAMVLATVYPSAVLRARIAGSFDEAYDAFVADLAKLKRHPT